MLGCCPGFCDWEWVVIRHVHKVVLQLASTNTGFSWKLSKSEYPAPVSLYPKKQCQIFFYPAKIYSQFKSWKLHTGIIILVNQGESLFCFKTSHARKDLRNFILAWRSEIQTSTKGHWGECLEKVVVLAAVFLSDLFWCQVCGEV